MGQNRGPGPGFGLGARSSFPSSFRGRPGRQHGWVKMASKDNFFFLSSEFFIFSGIKKIEK
jgi:hypothetical protein